MKLTSLKKENNIIIKITDVLKGYLDMSNIQELRRLFPKFSENDSVSVILDFEKISYIDSSVIGFLVEIFNERKNAGGTLGFLNVNEKIKNIFELANLTRFFKIYSSIDEIS